jgi:CheY-like chemotaxis protein
MSTPDLDQLTKMAKDQGRPYRVLIVDDEQWVQEVFKDFCELTNAIDVELAADGAEALTKIKTTEYDLITLDLIMPEMSGLDVLMAIKKTIPKVPIMIITGNATDSLVTKAGVLGACRVMYKPVALESFVEELTATLGRREK